MAADITDKARKSYSLLTKSLSAGISDVDTTIPFNNVTNIPTDTAVDFIIDRVDSNGTATPTLRELCKGVVSGSNLINCVRGVHGTTAQSHLSGAVVEFIVSASAHNDLIDLILAEHNQSGGHTSLSVSGNIDVNDSSTAIRDSSDNELVKFAKTSSAVNEITVTNAATGNPPSIAATGGDTNIHLDLNGKGTGLVLDGGNYHATHYYTYDGTDIFVDGVDQNNAANTISWSKPSGISYVIVEVLGAGGGGGGAAATAGGTCSGGAGGGGGVWALKKVLAASLGSTETITIGAAGVANSGAAGGAGGNSSFGSHATANGGSGGATLAASASGYQSATTPVTTGTGDVVKPGDPGGCVVMDTANNQKCLSGTGGNSRYGSGGGGIIAQNAGVAGTGRGSGGGGAANGNSQSARSGGAGTSGMVIVHEYY